MLPEAPLIVKVKVPVGALLPGVTVSVDIPEPVTVAGLKLALVRFGNPETLKLTVPENPPVGVMVIV